MKESEHFKVWDYDGKGWVQNNFGDYVELNWVLPGSPDEQECWVDIKHRVNAEIVRPDEDGNYQIPE